MVTEQIANDANNDAAPASQQAPASIAVAAQQVAQPAADQSFSKNDFKFLVYLLVDLKKLCVKLNNYFDADVAPTMRSCGVKDISFLKGNLILQLFNILNTHTHTHTHTRFFCC